VPHLERDGDVSLYYDDQGDGPAVLLLHGFVGDLNIDWFRSGILDRLLDEGYRVIGYDARGHGLSDKPHDVDAYAGDTLAADASALLDALGVDSCFVVGFSMGARTALHLATLDERVRGVAALGVGETSLRESPGEGVAGAALSDALLTDDADSIEHVGLRHYRDMADAIRADRVALAALMSAPRPEIVDVVDDVQVPVLVVTGSDDAGAGAPEPLAARLGDGRAVTIAAADHAGVKDHRGTQDAIVAFLAERA
jgi:pimeloyl-ACP methyl ester carboxylesterase